MQTLEVQRRLAVDRPEIAQKISASQAGRIMSEETKAKIRATMIERAKDPYIRAQLSQAGKKGGLAPRKQRLSCFSE